MALLVTQSPNSLSAAAEVGFSRRAAGVPVRERERRVDLPKEPVSVTPRRVVRDDSCLGDGQIALESNKMVRVPLLREDHGVWPLDAVVADIELLVRNIVQDERRHRVES